MRTSVLVMSFVVLSVLAIGIVSASWFDGLLGSPKTPDVTACSDSSLGVVQVTINGADEYRANSCTTKNGKDYVTQYSCIANKKLKTKEVKCKDSCITLDPVLAFGQTFTEIGKCSDDADKAKVKESKSCLDSDSGINASVAGVVDKTDNKGVVTSLADSCTNKVLTEQYCTKAGKAKSVSIKCKGDCLTSGSCEPLLRCSDSDLGKDTTKKGTVSINDESGALSFSVSDFCRDDKHVMELGCSRKTCESSDSWLDYTIVGNLDKDLADKVKKYTLGGKIFDSIMGGDESCSWTYVASSATYNRVMVKSIKCKSGCSNGACSGGEETPENQDE